MKLRPRPLPEPINPRLPQRKDDQWVRCIKSNVTEIAINGKIIMFSYQTPVAGYDDLGAFRTEQKYSVTTSRQINQYLGGKDIGRVVPQSYIDWLFIYAASLSKKQQQSLVRTGIGEWDQVFLDAVSQYAHLAN